MTNLIFRQHLLNKVRHAIQEADGAILANHPGLIGTIRELVASSLIRPILPIGFDTACGKIVDRNGGSSAEVDLLIYSRNSLPRVIYSDQATVGFYPVESVCYAFEIKSQSTASEIKDAIFKARQITALDYPGKQAQRLPRVVFVYFAFDSDLAEESELERYAKYDPSWNTAPAIPVICVRGKGY